MAGRRHLSGTVPFWECVACPRYTIHPDIAYSSFQLLPSLPVLHLCYEYLIFQPGRLYLPPQEQSFHHPKLLVLQLYGISIWRYGDQQCKLEILISRLTDLILKSVLCYSNHQSSAISGTNGLIVNRRDLDRETFSCVFVASACLDEHSLRPLLCGFPETLLDIPARKIPSGNAVSFSSFTSILLPRKAPFQGPPRGYVKFSSPHFHIFEMDPFRCCRGAVRALLEHRSTRCG